MKIAVRGGHNSQAIGAVGLLNEYVEDRKGHDRRYGIDSTKINEELGWYPKMDFYVGMKKTIQWYLNNQDWINNIKLGEYKKYYNKMYK